MNRQEQTRKVRQIADLAEGYLNMLTVYAEVDLTTANVDEVAEAAERAERAAELATRNAVELATDGTPTCQRHAERAVATCNEAVDLAATVRRAVEVERLRRVEAAHAKRTMLERDFPALAAVVAAAPGDDYFLDSAVALVRADDYRALGAAMDTFGPSSCWSGITLPDPGVAVTPFITEDTDARELAGVIRAYVERAESVILAGLPDPLHGTGWDLAEHLAPERAALDVILAAAHAAGWRAPGVAFDGTDLDVYTRKLDDGYEVAVWGGNDDYAVAEAATLAVARYGIFDDDHRPDDHDEEWWAWIVPGVPVWLPHVEAWREDMGHDMETLTLRQMDRASNDWEDWGRDTYLCAYAEAYAEAILDAETPATVGEDEDSGIHPEDRAEQARERAQAVVDELDVRLSDLALAELVPDEGDIIGAAELDARFAYRESVRLTRAEGMSPLF